MKNESVKRKIDPYRLPLSGIKPDGTADHNDRIEIGPTKLAFDEWAELGITPPNIEELRNYRLTRVRSELKKRDIPAALFFDPINIRYATDSSNMQVWTAHNLSRACFVPVDGPVILWDFDKCEHLNEHLPLIDEVRSGAGFIYFLVGESVENFSSQFAVQISELMRQYCGSDKRLAIDKIETAGLRAIEQQGIEVIGGQALPENAKLIKNENEINAMRCALASTEQAMAAMQRKLKPGISENELWASLHYENIRRGGEWIETRLLASGPRTNPWFQECGPRIIQEGDLLAFDTDLIGVYGYCADISRTWLCGDVKPTAAQRELYKIAHEEITYNMSLIKPGLSYREFSDKAYPLAEKYKAQRYGVMAHGIGLCDEAPAIYPTGEYDAMGVDYEGVLRPGMTICIESYIGEVGGCQGVKLEDQVLVTDTGFENLTRYPFEKIFMES